MSSPDNEDSTASVLAEIPSQDESDTGEGCGDVLRIRLRGSPQASSMVDHVHSLMHSLPRERALAPQLRLGALSSRLGDEERTVVRLEMMPKEPGMASAMNSCFTQNGVHLVRIVLPPLRRITRLLESQMDRSKHDVRDFYRYFDVYTRLLLYDLSRLEHSIPSPESEPSANCVLTRLDEVVSEDIHKDYPKMTLNPEPSHWKLRTLTEALLSTKSEELRLAEISQHIAFGVAEQRNTLVDAIKNYSDELNLKYPEDFILKEDFQPQKQRRKDPSYEIGVVANSLYQVLSNRMTCTCTELHDYAARIALATYRGRKDEGQKFDFDLIFCLEHSRSSWKETHVRASLAQRPKRPPRVQFVLDEPDGSVKRKHKGFPPRRQRINEICKPLKTALTSKLNRLNLELEDDELYKTQSTKTRFTSDELTNVITLGHLISTGTTSLGEKVKRVLAVLLGYAVLHHYGGSWLAPSWGRDDITFIKSATAIPLRPYMFTRVVRMAYTGPVTSDQEDDLDDVNPDDFPIHPNPDLVSLGTILLEVHTGKPIEVLAAEMGIEEEENINAKWSVADEVYKKILRDLPDKYSDAVNACLDPNFGSSADDLDGEESNKEDFRRLIYTDIVKPLEDELDQGFGKSISIDDLDDVAETMDLGSWGQTFQRKVPEQLEAPLPAPLQHHSSDVSISSHWPKHGSHEKQLHVPQSPVASDFKMFDDSSGPENISRKSCQQSDGWMKMILRTYKHHVAEPDTHQRVRIAVLDTGADPNHPDMDSERIQSIRSWVNGKDGEEEDRRASDESGHGTHTAGILLDLAPDADIYIAQIATKEPSHPSQIAKAIAYARKTWQVDIISMSFGFPRRVPGYDDLERAIRDAEYANILIFAAASNDGGNRKRAYPARDDKVICVHSSDGQGNPSVFNPTHVQNQDNFSTLGEAVKSSWPVGLCELEKNPEAMVYKSGTSFATPIAAATAAFLLLYARQNLSPAEAALLKRTAGMKAVLNLISESRQGFSYIAPSMAPDSFFGKGKPFIMATMTQAINSS